MPTQIWDFVKDRKTKRLFNMTSSQQLSLERARARLKQHGMIYD